MAKTNQITVNGVDLMTSTQRIDWTKFKNTPSTLVSASGHNHDNLYYRIDVVDSKFETEENRVSEIETQIEVLAYKTDLMLGGGGSSGAAIHNYNLSTEATSELKTTLLKESSSSVPGISSSSYGYFTNEDKSTSKFDYFTLVIASIPNSIIIPIGSLIDFAVQTKGFITDGNSWMELNEKLDTWSSKSSTIAGASGRPMLSSTISGFSKNGGTGMLRKLSYRSGISEEVIEFTTIGITSGLNRNSNKGYWISKINGNFEHSYLTNVVQSFNSMVNNADNSSTSTSDIFGLIASGGNGTTVQKLNWTNLSISTSTPLTVDKNGACAIEQ